MYRIGEFSFINKVSVKTLRYYDTIDLFKPKIVDEFTGYRYYSDDQQETFDEIMKYKGLGFSLEEIKEIINSDEERKKVIIDKHMYKINKKIIYDESQKRILRNMINDIPRIEFEYFYFKPCYLKRVVLKNRKDDSLYEEIKKDLISKGFKTYRKLFVNYEVGYCDKDIDALIGYEVNEDIGYIEGYKRYGADLKSKSLIGHGSKDEINDIYKDIIEYSKKNNIQIRGAFEELYDDNGSVEVFVDSFDLDEINEDHVHYIDHYKPVYEIDESLVGKYKIIEILPNDDMFLPGKQKSIPDTKFGILELHSDGTTNMDNIKWTKKALLLNYDNKIIPIHIHTYKEDKNRLCILFNEDYKYYKSQRPMFYIYERI